MWENTGSFILVISLALVMFIVSPFQVDSLESELGKAKDQIEMLEELIKCKDEVVCRLTDQLFEAEQTNNQVKWRLKSDVKEKRGIIDTRKPSIQDLSEL